MISPLKLKRMPTLVLLASVLFLSHAFAVITVVPIYKDISYKQARFFDFDVTNLSKEQMAYVHVYPSKKIKDKKGHVKWVTMKHDPRQFGFVVTPNKLAISPRETRKVRVLNLLKHYTQDVFLTVHFSPVTNSLVMRDQSVKKASSGPVDAKLGLQIVFAFDAVVVLRPPNAHATLTFKREGDDLVIANTGNSFADVTHFQYCDKEKKCQPLFSEKKSGNRSVYAHGTISFSIPKVALNAVSFKAKETFMKQHKTLTT